METNIKPIWGTDYRPGTVIFLRNNDNLISKGISWFENLDEAASFSASHVAFVVNETMGLESSVHGIQPFHLSKYFDDKSMTVICRELIGLDDLAFRQAYDYGLSIVGRWYAYPGLIIGFPAMILSPFDNIFPVLRKLPLPLNYFGERVCSSFVADQWKHTDRYGDSALYKEFHVTRIHPNILWNRLPWKPFTFTSRRKFLLKRGGTNAEKIRMARIKTSRKRP